MRLRDGRSPLEGRVEVFFEGEWGTILDNDWGDEDAAVVCRQLGFPDAIAAVPGGAFEPASSSTPVHLDLIGCHGSEGVLVECEGRRVKTQEKFHLHKHDAGVVCAG